jgi:murein DD-endopeptidase MepM/ murein hydrolase activator NlpD
VIPCLRRERGLLGLATLGLLVALGPAAHGEPVAGPRTPPRMHEVKAGETLTAVARKYGVSVTALVKANRLAGPDGTLKAGRRLVIPPPESSQAGRLGAPPAASAAARPAAPDRGALGAPPRLALSVPDFDGAAPLFVWPVEGAVISTFGLRRSGWHGGVDIKAPIGTLVQAAAPGVVVTSGVEARYGRVVKIEHSNSFVTVYAHNDVNLVEVGDRVEVGDTIALVGRTGRATTEHLHFEIRHDGRAYNPLYLLPLPPRISQIDELMETLE